jgi:hypothetical protein
VSPLNPSDIVPLTDEQRCLVCQILAPIAAGRWTQDQAIIAAFACGVRVVVGNDGVPFMCAKHREPCRRAISDTGVEFSRPS